MARHDSLGMFWMDIPEVKVLKVKPERHPPRRTWEEDGYLPNLAEALEFKVDLFTDYSLTQSYMQREKLVYDIECYENYFLIAFMGIDTKQVIYFEFDYDGLLSYGYDLEKLSWVIHNFELISFNGIHYDLPITALAIAGKSTKELKQATNEIIMYGMRGQDVLRQHKVKTLKLNHVDIIEVAPLQASLKIYSGRIHAPRMQDLPFKHDSYLSLEQIAIVRWYCINDLNNTLLLYNTLKPDIQLRGEMSEGRFDLRSKSDAQIAEAVISREIEQISGIRPKTPEIEFGATHKYQIPAYIKYSTAMMNRMLDSVRSTDFFVAESGGIGMPKELSDLDIIIGNSTYRMGIGGLHSSEKTVSYVANENFSLVDRDVVSYYPRIILNLRLYPKQLGTNFLIVYERIVNRRLAAKAAEDNRTSNSLKIVINGSFGKLGSMYSVLYAPDLFIQVTVTGQLSLLMLIERLELAGIKVVSGNTDGVIAYLGKQQETLFSTIIAQWESDTNFKTEETRYKALYSKDVNNYIAIYDKPKKDKLAKTKGAYAPTGLSKNPTNWICVEAVIDFLTKDIPITATIRSCRDITKFVSVRTVKGGAVKPDSFELVDDWVEVSKGAWLHKWQMADSAKYLKDARVQPLKPPSFEIAVGGTFLGKSIRWYYAEGETGHIVNALNGHQVPKSEGAKPLMDLPTEFPSDINFDWYETEAYRILKDIAYEL